MNRPLGQVRSQLNPQKFELGKRRSAKALDMVSPTPSAIASPDFGAGYVVHRLVARGGMCEVFEARHRSLRRRCVLKRLRPELCNDPQNIDRLRLEAQVLASIEHPSLVRSLDFRHAPSGNPFLVLEYLDGPTLRQLLRSQGALPSTMVLVLIGQVISVLQTIHAHGILHRDIKPENIIIVPHANGPLAKLIDFGIAKLHRPSTLSPLVLATQPGRVLGTPRYASPEQVLGLGVDERSDLYSAGAVLYAMLTGQPPFSKPTRTAELVRAHALEDPVVPTSPAGDSLHEELTQMAMRSLEKRPADRFASAAEWNHALQQLAAQSRFARWTNLHLWRTPNGAIDRAALDECNRPAQTKVADEAITLRLP
jgi:serine/threonine protein kinase